MGPEAADALQQVQDEHPHNFDALSCLNSLKMSAIYQDQIVYVHRRAPRKAQVGDVAPPLSAVVQGVLSSMSISSLYSHQACMLLVAVSSQSQAQAINAARKGDHVMLTTATSSGKSICYLVPILESILSSPSSTAILLFPTKALAHDQLRVINLMRG